MIITLEGNISSGKTTVGNAIAETGRASFIEEPVGIWQTKYSENLLDLFYKDKKRFAYMFQNAAFLSRAKNKVRNPRNDRPFKYVSGKKYLFRQIRIREVIA